MQKGCYTCRRRRIKCDNNVPFCQKCQKTGRECLGYQKPLVWVKGVASRGKMMGLTFDDFAESGEAGNAGQRREGQLDGLQLGTTSDSLTDKEDDSLPLVRRPNLFDRELDLILRQPTSPFTSSIHSETSQGMKFIPNNHAEHKMLAETTKIHAMSNLAPSSQVSETYDCHRHR